jgi:hypothetical protein
VTNGGERSPGESDCDPESSCEPSDALRLDAGQGVFFQMEIAGFEISNFRRGHRNEVLLCWPILWIQAGDGVRNWSADSSLGSTRELARLGNWFMALASRRPPLQSWAFPEPGLRFEWRRSGLNRRAVLVHLDGEMAPAPEDQAERAKRSRTLEFDLDRLQLQRAGKGLMEMSEKKPPRQGHRSPPESAGV